MNFNLNDFARDVHAVAVKHGWWEKEPSANELVAMIHCEWSEALMEYRDGKPNHYYNPSEDICSRPEGTCTIYMRTRRGELCRNNWCVYQNKPEGVAVELIDGALRILDLMVGTDGLIPKFDTIDTLCKAVPQRLIAGTKRDFPEFVCALHQLTSDFLNGDRTKDGRYDLYTLLALVFTWCKEHGEDPQKLLIEKHEYNETRPYRHGGKLC